MWLDFMENGSWRQTIPELGNLQTLVEQNDWHNDTPWAQSLRLMLWVSRLPETLWATMPTPKSPLETLLASKLHDSNGHYSLHNLLSFIAIIHDIGKTATFQRKLDSTTICPGHEAVGAEMALTICQRFNFTTTEVDFISTLVAHHGEPYALFKKIQEMPLQEQEVAITQFEEKHALYLRPLLLLAYGDVITSHLKEIKPTKFTAVSGFYRNWLQKLFQADEQLLTTARKNQETCYGLTIVAGLPLPIEVFEYIQLVQQRLDRFSPERFSWYQRYHSHVTLYAPLRSRRRANPHLQRQDLPGDLNGFVRTLLHCLARAEPFTIHFTTVQLTPVGHVVIRVEGADHTRIRLIQNLTPYMGVDAPKAESAKIHSTIGYLHSVPTDYERIQLMAELEKINREMSIQTLVDKVFVVHYDCRTLTSVVGAKLFNLNHKDVLTTTSVEDLLQELSIWQNDVAC